MKKIICIAAAIAACTAMWGCSGGILSALSALPTERATEASVPSANLSADPPPTAATDLILNADGVIDGMEYKYNASWPETTDPLTVSTLRTYDIDLGSAGRIQLRLEAINDAATSAAVQNLRTQSDVDRETVINGMIAAKEGTLTNASSRRAMAPPSGTRAMWAYEGETADNQSVHGYSYVGGSQLYEVSVTGTAAAYAAFEPTWNSLINGLRFVEIAPIETHAPTPEPTSVPTPQPTAPPTAQISSALEPGPQWYIGTWSGDDWEGDNLALTIDVETLVGDFATYDLYAFWGGSSGGSSIVATGEYEGAYVSYSGSIEYPDGTSHSISGRLTPTNKHSMSFSGSIEGRLLDPVELYGGD